MERIPEQDTGLISTTVNMHILQTYIDYRLSVWVFELNDNLSTAYV